MKKIFSFIIVLFGVLLIPGFGLTETCPNMTTVNGTNVTFVGELTDLGGDNDTYVWFEYGETSNYGQKTSEKILTQTGLYCISISNFSPCTTYHYRAGARNDAGTSYGEDKTFTTTCQSEISISKFVRNLSDGTSWLDSVLAEPGEVLSFYIEIKNTGSSSLFNVIVRDALPNKMIFAGNLKIDNILTTGDIISGLNIGNLSANQTKIITFNVHLAGNDQFIFGETKLINSASALDSSDIATVIVRKTGVLGATTVSTGLTNNLFLDSFLLPLIICLIIIFLFRSYIIKWEEWLDKRKKQYRDYKAKKLLRFKIAKIKTEEFLKKFERFIP